MDKQAAKSLLRWYADIGVDEVVTEVPEDWLAAPPEMPVVSEPIVGPAPASEMQAKPAPAALSRKPQDAPAGTDEAVKDALALARKAETVDDLRAALQDFDGCALKKTARNLCFVDGNPAAKVLFVGEGPGAEEDRQGLPFVGPSGALLDKMLASIGLDRTQVLISNTVFWRPPGNRTPTPAETEICRPFVERLIQIVGPVVIVAVGGPAAKMLLGETQGIGRLRGKWYDYTNAGLAESIPATPLFHPAYLLRSPQMKREAWADLLMLKKKLEELGVS